MCDILESTGLRKALSCCDDGNSSDDGVTKSELHWSDGEEEEERREERKQTNFWYSLSVKEVLAEKHG